MTVCKRMKKKNHMKQRSTGLTKTILVNGSMIRNILMFTYLTVMMSLHLYETTGIPIYMIHHELLGIFISGDPITTTLRFMPPMDGILQDGDFL